MAASGTELNKWLCGQHKELVARIRANCSEFHGLTPAEMERHIYSIVRTVERALYR